MTVEERRRRRFSEEFRKEQVELIESGKLTRTEVSKLYEVKISSIDKWLKKFGKTPLPEPILISNGKEYKLIDQLRKENERLLKLIGQQHVDLVYTSGLLELAKAKLGEDLEKK
jgi:transposase-like protein